MTLSSISKHTRRQLRDSFSMETWSNYVLSKNLPFIGFLVFLGILYISNAHYAESQARQINQKQSELKEIRWKYMALKSELMYDTKQIEIANKVKTLGIKELRDKPQKIVVSKNGRY
jgi:hypothetical protein